MNIHSDRYKVETEEIERLEKHLASLLDTIYYMKEYAEPELWNRYNYYFGDLEAKLAEKETELNSYELSEEKLKKDILASFSTEKISKDFSVKSSEIIDEDDTNFKLAKLYRDLVKVLHPDVSKNLKKSNDFWHQVKDAKEKNDIERLQTYHNLLVEDKSKNDIYHKLQSLNQQVKKHQSALEKLKCREPFIFKGLLSNKNWIEQKRGRLLNQILLADIRLVQKKRLLDSLQFKSKAS